MSQSFGGDWTEEKLTRIRKYLPAYTKILNNQLKADGSHVFQFEYIDAFAGTGYNEIKDEENTHSPLFPELIEADSTRFRDGSATIALEITPPFQKYIFVEKDPARFLELEKLKSTYPTRQIELVNGDANSYLIDICIPKTKWKRKRAVLFLDPFGMQVNWTTIKAIADTKAIDLWYLFPLGIGVNRLLKRDGNINPTWRTKLDTIFGDSGWYEEFYKVDSKPKQYSFLESEDNASIPQMSKIANWDAIKNYLITRLKTVFPYVANNPLMLRNSHNIPIYLLCFASSNETALKIANHILGKP